MDLRYVKKLLEMLDESTVDSLEISSEKGMRIRLSKSSPARALMPMAAAPVAPVALPAPVAAAPVAAAPAAPAEPAKSSAIEVKSPMVGTFYGAPEPGAAPYVAVGQTVKQGQVLCIIEAMKIMNEIESEVSGTVVEVCGQDAHPVEFGQVLFRVRPN
ncbi:MAG: acetyl-CoA carboxylase biotin carboxyl carrier protein [Gemmatimonadota bacterium]|nr:acetyl-CoA carboxylase biotin carboxyl carrier protein [Gemmatimonadota bacterium]MDQ8146711.1 acetyl-CoA carboxylase biotin carboxyl carrier protein [Gemmatimonadota bacterium]MDQ8149128.1 acetyl-CoA carboxylase biotin carboxyl carrier protein [Gemmatimonadota bacterium]MDQ8157253.1 acetyl-CoA carboxylase biotin carboxyl carrier protein [Gemmatimonadota bacterium]MDQ8176064.1 acetyl-CoA carboxylase biotin carboxyl carrier protein [Gemmatimonadota bacterium]